MMIRNMNIYSFYICIFVATIAEIEVTNAFEVIPLDLKKCDISGNALDLQFKLVNNGKRLEVVVKLDEDLQFDQISLNLMQEIRNGAAWQLNMDTNSKLCESLDGVADQWERARQAFDPPIEDECFLPSGEYKLNDYELFFDEIQSSFEKHDSGEYRLTLKFSKIKGKDKEEFACYNVELEVKK